MIAFAPCADSNLTCEQRTKTPDASNAFLKLLPAIRADVRFAFRRMTADAHEEATQEAVSNAYAAFSRLVDQGRAEVAAASPLARFAVAQVRAGRMIGTRYNVRDVLSPACRQRKRVVVERLDQRNDDRGGWKQALVEDRTCTPAELAASRIDFAEWLDSLPARRREIAQRLASGESTCDVAREFHLSPARISQIRNELRTSWDQFHEPKTSDSGVERV